MNPPSVKFGFGGMALHGIERGLVFKRSRAAVDLC